MDHVDLSLSPALLGRAYTSIYRPLDTWSAETRVLDLEDSDDDTAIVSCTIRTISLQEETDYVALSYVCGPQTERVDIKINGLTVSVTTNLAHAMRYIRSYYTGDRRLALWADAISIDQSNLKERGEQVQLMDHIYRKAQEVAVWFGPKIPHAEYAFEFLQAMLDELLAVEEKGLIRRMQPLWYHFSHNTHGFLDRWMETIEPNKRPLYLQALTTLYSLEYFDRIWTIQEAVLNANVVLHMEELHLEIPDFELLYTGINMLPTCQTLDTPMVGNAVESNAEINLKDAILTKWSETNDASRSATSVLIVAYRFAYGVVKKADPVSGPWLAALLEAARLRNATDDRDRVYALLGLLGEYVDIVPDYTIPVEEVYEEATINFLKAFKSMQLLFQGCSLSTKVPSWTFDFRFLADQGFRNPIDANDRVWFDGSLGLAPSLTKRKRGIIETPGLAVSQLTAVMVLKNSEAKENIKTMIDNIAAFMQANLDEDVTSSPNYLCRLTCMLSGGHLSAATVERSDGFTEKDSEIFKVLEDALADPDDFDGRIMRTRLVNVLFDTVVFCTSSGRFGIARHDVAIGDWIFVLQGAETPCMLRQVRGTSGEYSFSYKLLGSCYVDGIMNGEAITSSLKYQSEDANWPDKVFEPIVLI